MAKSKSKSVIEARLKALVAMDEKYAKLSFGIADAEQREKETREEVCNVPDAEDKLAMASGCIEELEEGYKTMSDDEFASTLEEAKNAIDFGLCHLEPYPEEEEEAA